MNIKEFSEEEVEMIENEVLSVKYSNTLVIEFPVKKVLSDPTDIYSNKTVTKPTAISKSIHCGMEYGVNGEVGADKTLAYVKEKVRRKINHDLAEYIRKFSSTNEQEQLKEGRAI